MKNITRLVCLMLTILIVSGTAIYAAGSTEPAVTGDKYVPVKYVVDASSWDAKTRTATFEFGKNVMKVKVGTNQIVVNSSVKKLDEKIITVDGRVVLPLSVLSKYLFNGFTSDDYIKKISVKFLDLLKQGQASECSTLLSKEFSKYLTSDMLKTLAPALADVQPDMANILITKNLVHQNVAIPFTVQQVKYNLIIRFDYDDKIDELGQTADETQFTYSKPAYDRPDNYTEKEVTIGDGEWKLPGTLTMPKGKGPFPAVILVHGSGPSDRDETVGPLKPFKDLASGLASQGIAVLRYEKRTLEHGTKIQLLGDLTMTEEFVQDAFAAADFLKTVNDIDSSKITVLGHSEGGYVLPRIMQNDKKGVFNAGIIMSGCARPIYELLPEQYQYMAGLGMVPDQQVEAMKAQVGFLEDESFNPAKPPEGYALGTPYYYYDMKNYDVLGITRAIEKPILVLQGERDYQVSPKTDFEIWKKAFDGKATAEFKLYPKLNHMYTEGEGQPTPNEYYVNANIPQYVIDDMAAFIKK